jgi:hypothetical protein
MWRFADLLVASRIIDRYCAAERGTRLLFGANPLAPFLTHL